MEHTKITRLKLENFTAFRELEMDFSPGINVFIGDNGTGKTHLLKVMYAACDITNSPFGFSEKINNVFLPSQRKIGKLVHRKVGRGSASIEVYRGQLKAGCSFSNLKEHPSRDLDRGIEKWRTQAVKSAYIPVKEMLANAPGFTALYDKYAIHYEEVYKDIINCANFPVIKGPYSKKRKLYIDSIKDIIKGRIYLNPKTNEFVLQNLDGSIEFTLVAEGMRKLALLQLLIQNDILVNGSILFYDEPEANLNPRMKRAVIDLLLKLQRDGVQIFLATHDYIILKYFDLLANKEKDKINFFSLYRDDDNIIRYKSTEDYIMIEPNLIQDTFLDLYDKDIARALGRMNK